MGTRQLQKSERDIGELRQSTSQMLQDLLALELTPEDRAAISRVIQLLHDDLNEKFERGT